MSRSTTQRAVLRVAAAVAAVVALAGACTTDDGVEVRAAGGRSGTERRDAETLLRTALDGLTSGRVAMRITTTMGVGIDGVASIDDAADGAHGGLALEVALDGEFGDGAFAATVTTAMGGGDGPELTQELRQIGSDVYVNLSGLGGSFTADALGEVLGGKSWVRVDASNSALSGPQVGDSATILTDPDAFLTSLSQIESAPAVEVDGETLQVVTASVDQFGTGFTGVEGSDGRFGRAMSYLHERMHLRFEARIDAAGRLRSTRATTVVDIEDQYRHCILFLSAAVSSSAESEFSDLGVPVVVEAPDPATVAELPSLAVPGIGGGVAGGALAPFDGLDTLEAFEQFLTGDDELLKGCPT